MGYSICANAQLNVYRTQTLATRKSRSKVPGAGVAVDVAAHVTVGAVIIVDATRVVGVAAGHFGDGLIAVVILGADGGQQVEEEGEDVEGEDEGEDPLQDGGVVVLLPGITLDAKGCDFYVSRSCRWQGQN